MYGVTFHFLASFGNLREFIDDESVYDCKYCDWSKPEENLTDYQVHLEHAGLADLLVLLSHPPTPGNPMATLLTAHLVLEAQWDVEENAKDKREADMDLGILEGVKPLEVCGSVDGDVPVDCHADDDVDRAGHERVDER